jgi:UDP-2,3-diacylglucosamine hydrolase
MSRVYFMSDAHLGLTDRATEWAKEDRIIAFWDSIKDSANELFILGDLFDAWIEYRTVIPKGFHRTLSALEDLRRRGIVIHFLAGNHDCWLRDYLSDEIGITVHHKPFDVILDGKKIYLHHGDGLAVNDSGYRIMKKILRNRIAVWLFSWIHPDIGLKLARSSSHTSRRYTTNKHFGEEDGMLKFAQGKIEAGYDYVIMGHRHLPVFTPVNTGAYVNLGDWIKHMTYAVLEDGNLKLNKWE